MLKAYLSLAILLSSLLSFAATDKITYDYYIIFVGEFKHDKISLSINKKTIINNYVLENTDPAKQGNLSITQNDDYLIVAYNGKEIKRSKISVDFDLALDISVNDRKKAFHVNLKKGKVILIDYTPKSFDAKKELSVEQVQEPLLLI
ncbi:MAG: hypothetical protein EOO10_18060 [Chitinophagaceae bacterium]|nr:MAG: hypothetical protein EOO10_18060 [Chitinophagaceae bacterium]